ncbi:MAG: glycosyltransferase family 2 protein [Deltaproteobacteria bacterium]|nr:glycosyltransferase family 2 protein [Deltaproteobacteria bacterium]
MRLSIVLPVYNEEENLPLLAAELQEVVAGLVPAWQVECVFVDDGSTDRSRERMLEIRERYPSLGVRVVALDRNWGLTAAMDAGFRAARGEVVVTLDTDLQNDPRDIPRLLEHLDRADVVVGVRARRRDPFVKRVSSRIANAIRNRVTHDDIVDTGCSLKVYRREYLTRLKLFNGLHRFLPTLLKMEGARVMQVPVNHRPRRYGAAKYHLWNRLVGPLMDLFAVRWMQKRHLGYRWEEIR